MKADPMTAAALDRMRVKIKPQPVLALVDDSPGMLDLVHRILREDKYKIHYFQRAEDLLEEYSEIQPDVILMEAILPGMSGISALTDLKLKNPEELIPVMILSEKSDPRAKVLAFRKGASDYLVKPFDADELAVRVRSLMKTRMLHQMSQLSSVTDPLTFLYNRRLVAIWLEKEVERIKRNGLALSCLWIDLDSFGRLNEKQGKRFGDFVLQEFAKLLVRNIRSADLIGRMQNDDFVILLPGIRKEQAVVIVQRLRRLLEKHNFQLHEKKTNLTFCAGVVSYHAVEDKDPSFFLDRAEEALSKAKAIGAGETAVLGTD